MYTLVNLTSYSVLSTPLNPNVMGVGNISYSHINVMHIITSKKSSWKKPNIIVSICHGLIYKNNDTKSKQNTATN